MTTQNLQKFSEWRKKATMEMTLRDCLAAKVIHIFLDMDLTLEGCASSAYELADAMMEARVEWELPYAKLEARQE